MPLNKNTRRIAGLLETELSQSEIARQVGVRRQRVHQVKNLGENSYRILDASKLKVARQRIGWSMRELARRLDISPSTVSRWESGKENPWPSQWERVSKLMGVKVTDLE